MAQSPWLLLHNQLALTKFEDASNKPSIRWYIDLETRLIDGILTQIRGCMGNRPSINLVSRRGGTAVYSRVLKNGKNGEEKQEYAKHIAPDVDLLFAK